LGDRERLLEERVRQLRDSILSAGEIKQMDAPAIPVPEEYVAAYKRYSALLEAAEGKLGALSPAEREAEMAEIECQKKETYRGLVSEGEEELPSLR